jgi:hypothetical protein
MSSLAVRTDEHLGPERAAQFAPPQLERAGRRELVIVEVRMDEQGFHPAKNGKDRGGVKDVK